MDAVESGKADYGYGNAYSVAFYTLQNGYRNIITVPGKIETRAYCIAFRSNDEMLLSIINKAISSIDESHMHTLILNEATRIERKITVPMIMDAYGKQILGAAFIIIAVLLISIVRVVRAKKKLKFTMTDTRCFLRPQMSIFMNTMSKQTVWNCPKTVLNYSGIYITSACYRPC